MERDLDGRSVAVVGEVRDMVAEVEDEKDRNDQQRRGPSRMHGVVDHGVHYDGERTMYEP